MSIGRGAPFGVPREAALWQDTLRRIAALERASSSGGGGGDECCPIVSDTEPVAPEEGVIWVDPTADCGAASLKGWQPLARLTPATTMTFDTEDVVLAGATRIRWSGVGGSTVDGDQVWLENTDATGRSVSVRRISTDGTQEFAYVNQFSSGLIYAGFLTGMGNSNTFGGILSQLSTDSEMSVMEAHSIARPNTTAPDTTLTQDSSGWWTAPGHEFTFSLNSGSFLTLTNIEVEAYYP